MAKYHTNKAGNPGICKAKTSCPFGDLEDDHYTTPEDARKAYELKQELGKLTTVKKEKKTATADEAAKIQAEGLRKADALVQELQAKRHEELPGVILNSKAKAELTQEAALKKVTDVAFVYLDRPVAVENYVAFVQEEDQKMTARLAAQAKRAYSEANASEHLAVVKEWTKGRLWRNNVESVAATVASDGVEPLQAPRRDEAVGRVAATTMALRDGERKQKLAKALSLTPTQVDQVLLKAQTDALGKRGSQRDLAHYATVAPKTKAFSSLGIPSEKIQKVLEFGAAYSLTKATPKK